MKSYDLKGKVAIMSLHKIVFLTVVLLLFCVGVSAWDFIPVELVGKQLADYPYFQITRSINEDNDIYVAVDPSQYPSVIGEDLDIYIVQSKLLGEWLTSPTLVDVRPGGFQTVTCQDSTIQENTFLVAGPFVLVSQEEYGLGVGYDAVLDLDQNGLLNAGDLIDGFSDQEAGFYSLHDACDTGPLNVTITEYSGGGFLTQRLFYPSDIAGMGQLPLVVVSHGWCLFYDEYDHIGNHLASYGYIVVVHTNDTGGGDPDATMSAAISTIDNIDFVIGYQDTIAGGVLNGHLDQHNIVSIGHSTGGEGVVRAYTGICNGDYFPWHFDEEDYSLICCLPPVSFWSADMVDPYDVDFHMFLGGADGDCSSAPEDFYVQSMAIFERSTGNRQLTYVHGAGHWDFCTSTYPGWADGPDQIGRAVTNTLMRGYLLPLVEYYTKDNPAGMDYLQRMYDDIHPIGIPDTVVISNEYRDAEEGAGKAVIDNYESNPQLGLSSSGGAVTYTVSNIAEVLMQDFDDSFDWTGTQQSNGMTRSRFDDSPHCVVLDWTFGETTYYEQSIVPALSDFTEYRDLSFRACQGTRHPNTISLDDGLSFAITLRDQYGASSTISTDNYGGVTCPYQRTGYGSGAGWANEFCTIRLRLADFLTNGSGIDLVHIEAVRFEFGSDFGSERGRIGLDDIELVDPTEGSTGLFSESGASTDLGLDCWPNPFAGTINVSFNLLDCMDVQLCLYDITGRLIHKLINSSLPPGEHSAAHVMSDLPLGLYILRLQAGEVSETMRCINLR